MHTLLQLFRGEQRVDQFVRVREGPDLPLEVILEFQFEQIEVILMVIHYAMLVFHFVFYENVTYRRLVEYFTLFF